VGHWLRKTEQLQQERTKISTQKQMTNPNLRNDKQTPEMNLKHSVNPGKIVRGGDCTYPITSVPKEALSQRTRVFSLSQGAKVEMS